MSYVIQNHPQKAEINDMLMSGISPARVAEKFGLNKTTAYRYRNMELKPALAAIDPNLIVPKTSISSSKDGNPDLDEGVSRMNDAKLSQMQNQRLSLAAQFVQKISQNDSKRQAMLDHTFEEKDAKGFSAIDGRILSAIELQARLSGALQDAAPAGPSFHMTVAPNGNVTISASGNTPVDLSNDAGETLDIDVQPE